MEGEGCFRVKKSKHGGGQIVSASQKAPETLLQLQKLFGGSIGKYANGTGNKFTIHIWHTHGARARGIMMTLFTFLSAKRRAEIRLALGLPATVETALNERTNGRSLDKQDTKQHDGAAAVPH